MKQNLQQAQIAPSQSMAAIGAAVQELMMQRNAAASQLLGGRLSNAFALRMCVGSASTLATVLQLLCGSDALGWLACTAAVSAWAMYGVTKEYYLYGEE